MHRQRTCGRSARAVTSNRTIASSGLKRWRIPPEADAHTAPGGCQPGDRNLHGRVGVHRRFRRANQWPLALAIALIASITSAPAAQADDAGSDGWANTDDVTVDAWNTEHAPGSTPSDSHPESGSGRRQSSSAPHWKSFWEKELAEPSCASFGTCTPRPPAQRSAPPPTVRVEDLANFRPAVPVIMSEPQQWTLVGVSTNLWVSFDTSSAHATLLGAPAEVRFSPIRARWHIDSRSATETETIGRSWSSLHVPEFTETTTSATFATPGLHRVSAEIEVSASYRLAGGDWLPVRGTLWLTATPTELTVFAAGTALVNQSCSEDSLSAGC